MASAALKGHFDNRWRGGSIPKKHWHFHRALYERYGIVLAPGEFSKMLKDIRSGRALRVKTMEGDRSVYFVRLKRVGERFFVLVVKGHIVTALPASKRLVAARKLVNP